MPTTKKRHTCALCKRKLIEDLMIRERRSYYCYKLVWVCGPTIDLSCKRLAEFNKSVRSGSGMDTGGPAVSIPLQQNGHQTIKLL